MNVFDILRLLERSDCGQCGERACLAFAAKVHTGQRRIGECPRISPEQASRVAGLAGKPREVFREGADALKRMAASLRDADLEGAAQRLGLRYANGRLGVPIMGRALALDREGRFHTDLHVNPWLGVPLIEWVLYGAGSQPSGTWAGFRELDGGWDQEAIFRRRCEEPLRRVADAHPELFPVMLETFSGTGAAGHLGADVAVVLRPLPLVPVLFCYWRAEGPLDSDLKVFFDRDANKNLSTESLFTLGAGLSKMLCRIAARHAAPGP